MPADGIIAFQQGKSIQNICRPETREIVAQYLGHSAEFSQPLNVEGEACYRLSQAIELMRPSIIFGLAKIASDQAHFAKLIERACIAASCHDAAEEAATDACISFDGMPAHSADAAFSLVMLAAAQAVFSDDEWTSLNGSVRRIVEALG